MRSAHSVSAALVSSSALTVLFALSACGRTPEGPPASAQNTTTSAASDTMSPASPTPLLPPGETATTAAATAPANANANAKIKLGAPFNEATATTALADIEKNPGAYKGKSVTTTGTVRAVCQERGCWMEIVDEAKHANVRMHGHAFFVPKTASGKKARVQGTVVLMKDGKECDEMAETGAQLELDATSVELM